MGAAGARHADLLVLTSDNPRGEDPQKIISEILPGVRQEEREEGGLELVVEANRREAIRSAVTGLGAGDVLLIAGKGHENQQVFEDEIVPFDDRSEARRALALCGWL